MSGSDLSLLVLYMVPVGACSWYAGKWVAVGMSALALAAWIVAQVAFPSHVDIPDAALVAWGIVEKIVVFGILIGLIVRVKKLIADERTRANTDYITGLPNRRAFNAKLVQAKEGGKAFSLVFMELGGLDDTYLDYGEAFVESLLREMAVICRRILPGYRYSDDRFATILAEVSGPAAVKRVEALMAALKTEVFERRRLDLRFKVGIASCADCEKLSLPALLRFLEGGMVNLHGREGHRLEFFQYC